MSSESQDNEEGSQQTQQSRRNTRTREAKEPGNKRHSLRGELAAPGSNVCAHGRRDQGDWHVKTAEAISGHVRRECSKEMRLLVMNKQESPPTEPRQPKDDKNAFEVTKHKTELSQHCNKLDQCHDCKAKVFAIVKGQCTLSMKNEIESSADCKDWEKNDDVIGLPKGLKELSFSAVDMQCEHWTMNWSVKDVMMMKQQDRESLAGCCKQFVNTVDVAETQWGILTPTTGGSDKATRNKFLACTFPSGVDKKKHGKVASELNNSHLTGQNNHPVTVEAAVMMLTHCMGDKPVHRSEQQQERGLVTSFAQWAQHVMCCKCGKKGHCVNNCPENSDSDGDSVRSSRVGWSG